jgi:hypothetical protein
MENYIKIYTNDAIEKLVRDEINTIISNNFEDTIYLESILEIGFKGYINYTDKELEEELEEKFGNKYKIIYDL